MKNNKFIYKNVYPSKIFSPLMYSVTVELDGK